MKLFILPLLLFSHTSWSESCALEWGESGKKKVIELVEKKDGCRFTKLKAEDCFQLRSIDQGREEIGATVFRKSVKESSYCLENNEQDSFVSVSGIRALIECSGVRKPTAIRLESPDGKKSRRCPFPYLEMGPKEGIRKSL